VKRFLCLLCILVANAAIPAAHAMPVFTGPLIATVNTDRASYTQGQPAQIAVTLTNTTGSAFAGTVTATTTGRGEPVGAPVVVAVPSLAVGASTTVTLTINTPQDGDYRGYYVALVAANTSGTAIDTQGEALDVSSSYTVYPRQCWVTATWTAWPSTGHTPEVTTTPEQNIDSLNAWHCNNLQFFNMLYRWNQPYRAGASYTNGDGLVQNQSLILRNVGEAKLRGLATFGYVPMYAAAGGGLSPDFQNDGTGAQFAWGMFTDYQCGKSGDCALTDMAGFGGSNASVANIALMDPTNTSWQAYWAQQVNIWVRHYGFDGLFIDTYGNLSQYYRENGNGVAYASMLSGFLNAAVSNLNMPTILNTAGPWLEQDLVQNGHEAFHFVERWDHSDDIATYDTFHATADNAWKWASRTPHNLGLDWDMGLDKTLASSSACQSTTGATCTFSLPGALYLEAAIQATGAHHNWLVDGDRFISNDDYPMWGMLKTTPAFLQAEYDYQNFGVAYEKLLRDNISDSTVKGPVLTGATGATTATAGDVWTLQKARSGLDILHLVNFTALNSAQMGDVQDPNGNYPAPTAVSNLTVKMYVTTGGTLGNLYWASPDVQHGAPQQISYSTGSDSNGSYVTFAVPSLAYWDVVWLENGVASSDYAAN